VCIPNAACTFPAGSILCIEQRRVVGAGTPRPPTADSSIRSAPPSRTTPRSRQEKPGRSRGELKAGAQHHNLTPAYWAISIPIGMAVHQANRMIHFSFGSEFRYGDASVHVCSQLSRTHAGQPIWAWCAVGAGGCQPKDGCRSPSVRSAQLVYIRPLQC
jgi:hypothetical protein